jgi:hypothetical protein
LPPLMLVWLLRFCGGVLTPLPNGVGATASDTRHGRETEPGEGDTSCWVRMFGAGVRPAWLFRLSLLASVHVNYLSQNPPYLPLCA